MINPIRAAITTVFNRAKEDTTKLTGGGNPVTQRWKQGWVNEQYTAQQLRITADELQKFDETISPFTDSSKDFKAKDFRIGSNSIFSNWIRKPNANTPEFLRGVANFAPTSKDAEARAALEQKLAPTKAKATGLLATLKTEAAKIGDAFKANKTELEQSAQYSRLRKEADTNLETTLSEPDSGINSSTSPEQD